jgi:hypothetical protein
MHIYTHIHPRTYDGVRVLNGAHEVHLLDVVGLGALLDDHRQSRLHVVLALQSLAELLGSTYERYIYIYIVIFK